MTQDTCLKFPYKSTKLRVDQRVISLYAKMSNALYAIYFTLTVLVNGEQTLHVFMTSNG